MTWQITAKSGSRRGMSWLIGNRPITLGRSLNCEITVSDPTVSRRHCEIAQVGQRVKFRDLGSRNVTLINGRISDECYLELGDELSLGTDSFIVTREVEERPAYPATPRRSDDTTVSFCSFQLPKQSEEDHTDLDESDPIEVVSRLYQMSQQLHQAQSEAEFSTQCLRSLQDVFPVGSTAYVLFRYPDDTIVAYPSIKSIPERVLKQINESISSGTSSLKTYRKRALRPPKQVCVSPLISEKYTPAAIILIDKVGKHPLDETHLKRLDDFGKVAALHLTGLTQRLRTSKSANERMDSDAIEFLEKIENSTELRERFLEAASTRLNTLITGEPRTGKKLAAQMIHRQSAAPKGPMILRDCQRIAGDSFACDLLGEEQVDEDGSRIVTEGLLEQANGGTLILANIGALTPGNQGLMARVLDSKAFIRLGASGATTFRGRIISTSREEPENLVRDGKFRADLLRAIARQRLHTPPHRTRRNSIRNLAKHLLRLDNKEASQPVQDLADEAIDYLKELPLKGDTLELRRAISHAAQQRAGASPEKGQTAVPPMQEGAWKTEQEHDELDPLEHAEDTLLRAIVHQCAGDTAKAARMLGIPQCEVERIAKSSPGTMPKASESTEGTR
jgi:DNA-binding NtrC family response regulator